MTYCSDAMGYHQKINIYLKAGTTYLGHSSVKTDFLSKERIYCRVPKLLHKSAHGLVLLLLYFSIYISHRMGLMLIFFSVIKLILLLDTNR